MALNKDTIKDKIEVREFPVHAKYGDDEFDYTGVVLVIPNGLRWSSGRVTDATIGAVYDDKYGPGVHWDNKQEAEKWLTDNWDKLYLDSTRDGYVLVLPREDNLVEMVVKKMGNIESMTRDILMEELTPDLVKKIARALERNKALTSTYALTVSVEDLLSTNRNSNPNESGFYFILEGTRSGVSFFYNNNLEFSRKPNSKSVRVVKRYNNLRGFEESFWFGWAEKWLRNDIVEKIVKKKDGYHVTSEDGKKNLGGPYDTEDEAKKRLQQVHYFKNKDKKKVGESMKVNVTEGAEGKKEPGYEYIIYDYTDEDGPNPIVAKRSTRTEAEYLAMRWMDNDYITHSRPHPKYKDRYLTFEKVPKGKFKVGDDFYGPFDADYNKLESVNEDIDNEKVNESKVVDISGLKPFKTIKAGNGTFWKFYKKDGKIYDDRGIEVSAEEIKNLKLDETIEKFVKIDDDELSKMADKLYDNGIITKNQLLFGSLSDREIRKLYRKWFKENGKIRQKPKEESVEVNEAKSSKKFIYTLGSRFVAHQLNDVTSEFKREFDASKKYRDIANNPNFKHGSIGCKHKSYKAGVNQWVRDVEPTEFMVLTQRESPSWKDDVIDVYYRKDAVTESLTEGADINNFAYNKFIEKFKSFVSDGECRNKIFYSDSYSPGNLQKTWESGDFKNLPYDFYNGGFLSNTDWESYNSIFKDGAYTAIHDLINGKYEWYNKLLNKAVESLTEALDIDSLISQNLRPMQLFAKAFALDPHIRPDERGGQETLDKLFAYANNYFKEHPVQLSDIAHLEMLDEYDIDDDEIELGDSEPYWPHEFNAANGVLEDDYSDDIIVQETNIPGVVYITSNFEDGFTTMENLKKYFSDENTFNYNLQEYVKDYLGESLTEEAEEKTFEYTLHNTYSKNDFHKKVKCASKEEAKKLANDELAKLQKNGHYKDLIVGEVKELDESLTEAKRYFPWDFDEEDGFFTREELDEFTSELQDIAPSDVAVYKAFIDSSNVLEVDWSYQDFEETSSMKIDMRKIKTPSDLIKRYLPSFKFLIDSRVNAIEMGIDESLQEDVADYSIQGIFDYLKQQIKGAGWTKKDCEMYLRGLGKEKDFIRDMFADLRADGCLKDAKRNRDTQSQEGVKLHKDNKDMVEEGDILTDGSNKYVVTMVWKGPRSSSITVRDVKDWRPIYSTPISDWYGTRIIKGPFIRKDGELIKQEETV